MKVLLEDVPIICDVLNRGNGSTVKKKPQKRIIIINTQ